MNLAGPDPDLAEQLAEIALHAHDQGSEPVEDWAPLPAALLRLETLARTSPDEDLRAWAERMGDPRGELPLLGAAVRAATYPALLWNGDRCARAGLGLEAALTLVGLATGQPLGRSATELARALRGGLAVAATVDNLLNSDKHPAIPTRDVIAAAACAALLHGNFRETMPALLDTAGCLMLITPPRRAGVPVSLAGLWNGHALAAGWLAVRAHAAGITSISGGLSHTLSVVSGSPAGLVPPAAGDGSGVHARLGPLPAGLAVRSLVEALS